MAGLEKILARAPNVSAERMALALARRGRGLARGGAQELSARWLGLRGPAAAGLGRVVSGAVTSREAVQTLEARAGRLPAPAPAAWLTEWRQRFPAAAADLIARADRAVAGSWEILGFPAAPLGRRPDWQLDWRSGVRWDEREESRRQPIVREGSDIKIPWEVSRLQHLPGVALAFTLTKEARYLDLVVEQTRDWIARNPVGLGVNWTCPMEVALRAVSLSWAFELCRHDARMSWEARAELFWSLFAHGHFLAGHLEDGGLTVGNHFVADLLGLVWLGALYPAFRGASRWRAWGSERLAHHLARVQIRADGGDGESSLSYHRLVLEMVGLAAQVLAANGGPTAALTGVVRRMAEFTATLLKPDGTVAQLGDNDGGRVFRLLSRGPREQAYLVSWAGLVCEDPGLAAATPLDAEAALLHGPGALRRHEELAQRGSPRCAGWTAAFPSSGICVARGDDFHLLLAAAPVGQDGAGGHGHNDKLALELYLGGDLIADPGSFSYTGSPLERNRFRSTAAHATVQLDGREQNPVFARDLFFLPERANARVRVFDREGGGIRWVAEHEGFAPFLHRRTVRADPASGAVDVDDEILGPADEPHEVVARFPLAPGAKVERFPGAAGRFRVEREGAPSMELSLHGPPGTRFDVEPGWYSPDYGSRVSCGVLRAIVRARPPVALRCEIRRARG